MAVIAKVCNTSSKMSLAVARDFGKLVFHLFFVIKIFKGRNLLENLEKKGESE